MAPIVPDTKTRPTFLPADAKVVIVTDGVHDDIAKVVHARTCAQYAHLG
jgi:hypothetical protein